MLILIVLNKIFPKNINNKYKSSKIALYAFILITIFTIARSLIHIIIQDGGAQSIATIPLDTFSINASNTVILIFGYWGISQLIIGIIYLVVLLRYKELIPLMYLFFILEYTLRLVMGLLKPIETVNTAPGAVGNYILIPIGITLLILSLKHSKEV